ncbi:DNA-directed RNA polymerase subunit alpha [Candidatus Nomurabacteria bacterium]|nr:DNA-directed RNA polymerase subunit alpha [Candidatus Nomurabacteria bacterium]
MSEQYIALPSKPKIIKEENFVGIYEIDGLYPGYGHTLGNSLRRIILSSLPGAAITEIKIKGVEHEFSTIDGVKEDVIAIILNMKKIRLLIHSDESQTLRLKIKGAKKVTAGDIEAPSQIEVMNPGFEIFEITDKNTEVDIEMKVERGLGYVPKEVIHKDRVEVGVITLDAVFTPIKRVNYEIENMRVGDRTDFNRLRLYVETDGTITPKEALEKSIETMINQLKSIVGFKEELDIDLASENEKHAEKAKEEEEDYEDFLKTRVESLDLSQRTINALSAANIRTAGGLARKKEEDILEIEGLGAKGLDEIKKVLSDHNIELK